MECLFTTGGNVNWYSHFKKQHGVSLKKRKNRSFQFKMAE